MRYLIISNLPLESEEVYEVLEEHRGTHDLTAVHFVVPVSLADVHPFDVAAERMEKAIERTRGMGLESTGELGDDDPYLSLKNALDVDVFDRILITTLKTGASRWVRADLISRAKRLSDTPVDRIETEASRTG